VTTASSCSTQSFRPWGYDPILGHVRADGIDHRGLLADEELARAMEHQAGLLLGRLVSPGHRFADGLGISASFFCLEKRQHIAALQLAPDEHPAFRIDGGDYTVHRINLLNRRFAVSLEMLCQSF
jgi:hypothetical protein